MQVNVMEMSSVEKAFLKLHDIAEDWKNPTEKQYYIAKACYSDGTELFCFLGMPETEKRFGCEITNRKRYIVPISICSGPEGQEALKIFVDCERTSILITEKLNTVMEKGIGPLTTWQAKGGEYAGYRALCRLAELWCIYKTGN